MEVRMSLAGESAITATSGRPTDLRRLLLMGVGLPILVATLVNLIMDHLIVGHRPALQTSIGFGCIVIVVGSAGMLVGKAMQNRLLRWTLYCWMLLLMDLLVMSKAMHSSDGYLRETLPAAAFVAAQIGLAIVCGILGTSRWYWRVPIAIGVGAGLLSQWISFVRGGGGQLLTQVLILQAIALFVITSVLRMRGYRLVIPNENDGPIASDSSVQFGIRDVMICTTVMAVLLTLLRSADLLAWQSIRDKVSILGAVNIAVVSAIAVLFSMWAALGKGHWMLRYALLTILLPGLGATLEAILWLGVYFFDGSALAYGYRFWLEVGHWWIAWMFLSSGLLVASLMIFRTEGYRLVKGGKVGASTNWNETADAKPA